MNIDRKVAESASRRLDSNFYTFKVFKHLLGGTFETSIGKVDMLVYGQYTLEQANEFIGKTLRAETFVYESIMIGNAEVLND